MDKNKVVCLHFGLIKPKVTIIVISYEFLGHENTSIFIVIQITQGSAHSLIIQVLMI